MKKFLLLLVFLFSISTFSQNCDANPENVKEFIGKVVNVCGEVSQVSTPTNINGNPTYLNLGGKYPNSSFTIVAWGAIKDELEINLSELEGKNILINGLIKEYKGKPQIVIERKGQIIIIN